MSGGERANYDEIYGGTTAVGCFPQGATADGLHDLAGNVWEGTGSVYKPYPYDPQDGREDTSNPANKRFVMRGGGWLNRPIPLRASYRLLNLPDLHLYNLGLRPARHLP
jgi:formylglycine-generating enzyme required for sulfatase activity